MTEFSFPFFYRRQMLLTFLFFVNFPGHPREIFLASRGLALY